MQCAVLHKGATSKLRASRQNPSNAAIDDIGSLRASDGFVGRPLRLAWQTLRWRFHSLWQGNYRNHHKIEKSSVVSKTGAGLRRALTDFQYRTFRPLLSRQRGCFGYETTGYGNVSVAAQRNFGIPSSAPLTRLRRQWFSRAIMTEVKARRG